MCMKGIGIRQKRIVLAFLLCLFGCFFYSSCGLETIVVVVEPVTSYGNSLYSSTDPSYWFCDFVTREYENIDLPGADFVGTEVYYKIYNNYWGHLFSFLEYASGLETGGLL